MKAVKSDLSDFYIGQYSTIERVFTKEDVEEILKLSREENTVYFNEDFMKKANMKGTVVPGLLTDGLIMEVSSKKIPGSPGLLLQKELLYHHPVYVGDKVTAKIEVIDIDHKRKWLTLMVTCTNQDGVEVITGQIVAYVITI